MDKAVFEVGLPSDVNPGVIVDVCTGNVALISDE